MQVSRHRIDVFQISGFDDSAVGLLQFPANPSPPPRPRNPTPPRSALRERDFSRVNIHPHSPTPPRPDFEFSRVTTPPRPDFEFSRVTTPPRPDFEFSRVTTPPRPDFEFSRVTTPPRPDFEFSRVTTPPRPDFEFSRVTTSPRPALPDFDFSGITTPPRPLLPDFSGVTRNSTGDREAESIEVFFDAEIEVDLTSSLDFLHHSGIPGAFEETGECDSAVSSSGCAKSQETGECEYLLRRQLSHPDLDLSPPSDSPSEASLHQRSVDDLSPLPVQHRSDSEASWNSLQQRSNSDLSSPIRLRSTSDVSSVVSSLSSASQPGDSAVSVSGSLRPPSVSSITISHQRELFNAIKARRMDTELFVTGDNFEIREKTINGKPIGTDETVDSRPRSDSGVDIDSRAGSVLCTGTPTHTPPPPPPPPPLSGPPTLDHTHLVGILQQLQRPSSLSVDKSAQSSIASSPSSSMTTSPMVTRTAGPVRHDLIAELKKATTSGNSNLRKTKKPREEGRMTCIYSFGSTPKANGHVPSGLVSNGPSGGGKSGQAMRNGQHISEKVTSVPLSNGQAANDQQDLKEDVTSGQKTRDPPEKTFVILDGKSKGPTQNNLTDTAQKSSNSTTQNSLKGIAQNTSKATTQNTPKVSMTPNTPKDSVTRNTPKDIPSQNTLKDIPSQNTLKDNPSQNTLKDNPSQNTLKDNPSQNTPKHNQSLNTLKGADLPILSTGTSSSKSSNGVVTSSASSNGSESLKGADSSVGTSEFDPRNFMDKVDPTAPDWRRHMLARKMADNAKKEAEDRAKLEKEEKKYQHLPAWKRQMMEKRQADAKAEEARKQKLLENQKITTTPIVNTTSASKLAPWQLEFRTKKS